MQNIFILDTFFTLPLRSVKKKREEEKKRKKKGFVVYMNYMNYNQYGSF